jgi:hypothetical protein
LTIPSFCFRLALLTQPLAEVDPKSGAERRAESAAAEKKFVQSEQALYARPQERSRAGGAEGATAPETLRQKDRGRKGVLESSG